MRATTWEMTFQPSLRKCPGEVGGKVMIYVTVVRGVCAVKHTFLQKVAASREEQMPPLMILLLYKIQGHERTGLIKSPENI